MVEYEILYWYDIPIQVRGREGRRRLSQPLAERFQVAIDKAAMAAGLTGDDAYTDLYQWSEPESAEGRLEEVVERVASELEAKYPEIDWHKTARLLMSSTRLE